MKSQMTLKEYDQLCDRIKSNEYQCKSWWPSIKDIEKYIVENPEKYIEFMIWILETASPPETEEEKESKGYLNRILTNTIHFKEDDSYDEKR